MSALFYTIDGVRHDGFARLVKPDQLVNPKHRLVIVWFEGEPELWVVDSTESFDALRAMWRREWPEHVINLSILRMEAEWTYPPLV